MSATPTLLRSPGTRPLSSEASLCPTLLHGTTPRMCITWCICAKAHCRANSGQDGTTAHTGPPSWALIQSFSRSVHCACYFVLDVCSRTEWRCRLRWLGSCSLETMNRFGVGFGPESRGMGVRLCDYAPSLQGRVAILLRQPGAMLSSMCNSASYLITSGPSCEKYWATEPGFKKLFILKKGMFLDSVAAMDSVH